MNRSQSFCLCCSAPQDAQTYADWGVDYLKYDYCGMEQTKVSVQRSYEIMRDALNSTGRPILFSLCSWGSGQPHLWGQKVRPGWFYCCYLFAALPRFCTESASNAVSQSCISSSTQNYLQRSRPSVVFAFQLPPWLSEPCPPPGMASRPQVVRPEKYNVTLYPLCRALNCCCSRMLYISTQVQPLYLQPHAR